MQVGVVVGRVHAQHLHAGLVVVVAIGLVVIVMAMLLYLVIR
ncbi:MULTISPECIES: hypothetical protein [unclassified Bifidobacterium]|nr:MULTISPECIES: hypothetical protein [unclassified Bifidobacterium]